MSQKAKYLQVAKITWKSMIAYQTDTWLGAGVSGFRVLLAFLLWQAIFAGRSEVAGFTLPMMVTYYLVSGLLGRLQHQDGLAWQLATEVREGQFSKYLVRPMPVVGFFLGAGAGRWIFLLLVNLGSLLAWAVVFSRWLVPPANPLSLLWLLALVPLGALVMLLLNHDIALLSLRYQDITGFMILKGSILEFLSGVMIPLSLLPPGLVSALQLTPFYYVVYYPTSLFLGTQTAPPWEAILVLCAWCLVLFAAGQVWFLRARKYYEGVGI
ncbi:MAG TPA: ABC-2 family transporter protein [Anaerolineaceae bacterium]